MSTLELRLLGGFEVRPRGGPALDFRARKARLLFGYLALPPGRPHPRDRLATMLWSDRADAQAQHSLRQSLTVLRKALAVTDLQPLRADRRTVSLDPAAVTVDAVAFEELLAAGSVEALRQACALYRGELLAGESARDPAFDEWLFYERERCRDLALRAFERLLAHQRAAGERAAAVETAQRILAVSPAHEAAHRALMDLYAALGQRTAALEQYEQCRAALRRELAVTPEPETEALYREILRGRAGANGTAPEVAPVAREAAVAPEAGEAAGRATFAPPEMPSVAVLPFVNMSDDPGQAYFCDGITEDIITDLSRFRSLFVIARHSSFAFRDYGGDLRAVGRELGVEHIVEGSVQRAGTRVRITAQLINAEGGDHLWAERYDRDFEDIFAVQDEVTESIVAHITKRIEHQRLDVAMRKRPDSLQAYDYWLQAKARLAARSETAVAEGRRLIERALDLGPQFARAHAYLTYCCLLEAHYRAGGTEMREKIEQAFRSAQAAVSLDDTDSRSLAYLGWAHLFRREFEFANQQFERAATLNLCDADALISTAHGLAYGGDPVAGLELADRALRLNPYSPEWYRLLLASIHFLAGRYDDAYAASRHLSDLLPDTAAWKAAICTQVGRLDEARDLVGQLVRNIHAIWVGDTPPGPGACRQYLVDANPLKRQQDTERLLDSLYRAGLPR